MPAVRHCASVHSVSTPGSRALVLGGAAQFADGQLLRELTAALGREPLAIQAIDVDELARAKGASEGTTRLLDKVCAERAFEFLVLPFSDRELAAKPEVRESVLSWMVPLLSAPACTRHRGSFRALTFVIGAESLVAHVQTLVAAADLGPISTCALGVGYNTLSVTLSKPLLGSAPMHRDFRRLPHVSPQDQPDSPSVWRRAGGLTRNAHGFSGLKFLAIDYHIGPIGSVVELLRPFGVTVIEKSYSGHCAIRGTCQTDLRVFTHANAWSSLGRQLKRDLWDAYRNDPEWASLDGFLCFFPPALCEAFLPFNKTLIMVAPTRYEQGRHPAAQWAALNANMRMAMAAGVGVVGGNNLLDAEYIRYFTGLPRDQVLFMPDPCTYAKGSYAPQAGISPRFLIGHIPSRSASGPNFYPEFAKTLARLNKNIDYKDVRVAYPGKYEYADLGRHTAIIHPVPYQLSVMSFMEQYQMGIPLVFPSREFLLELERLDGVMFQRTWYKVHTNLGRAFSELPRHSDYDGTLFDPNDEVSTDAMRYWFSLADFYAWPHVILFDSWEDLAHKLETTDFAQVSRDMRGYTEQKIAYATERWLDVLDGVLARREDGHAPRVPPMASYEDAMDAVWGRGVWTDD